MHIVQQFNCCISAGTFRNTNSYNSLRQHIENMINEETSLSQHWEVRDRRIDCQRTTCDPILVLNFDPDPHWRRVVKKGVGEGANNRKPTCFGGTCPPPLPTDAQIPCESGGLRVPTRRDARSSL